MRAVSDAAPADRETATAPVRSGQRIAALDVLHGITLFGVFIMNKPGFTHSMLVQPVADAGALDRIVSALRDTLFAGKFNLLFGIGFTP